MRLSYDLHIHSCLSPCGDADMTPNNIVHMALLAGFDMIALTDHNTCGNCPALLTVAREAGLTAVPGMELCTAEEAHVVCLFPALEGALAFEAAVRPTLPPVENRPDIFGEQLLLDAQDGIVGREPYPVSDKAAEILQQLMRFGVTRFRALFQGNRSRSEVVATFIAVLELCKARRLLLAGTESDCTVTCTEETGNRALGFSTDAY